jgi:hypothetical protein
VILFLDLETFNEVHIKYGTPIYAQTAEVLLFSYSIDDLPVRVWDCTTSPDMPSELHLAIESADTLVAHNSFFDRNILRVAFPKFDWINNESPMPKMNKPKNKIVTRETDKSQRLFARHGVIGIVLCGRRKSINREVNDIGRG